ncbi:methionyl-tRNA formyltransferase [Formivibrio citricus]|uniref:Methionyl-tRNA formyltransferase n=1 Tax=Formivibrio citricus TaxID=83765 RepID=A0A1I4XWX5_9NEIS|nr:formyltransferase family protein [Formivibrio citricus]SFN29760.1 methionyl-tRNA formyltransferase [Formivibrio citricus]
MRIIFIGTVLFSSFALRRLIDIKANIVGVCTARQSKGNSDYFDLSCICSENGIPFICADDANSDDVLFWAQTLNPDVIFCFGWSRLLKKPLLELAPLGVVGFHPAALPANRGRHPLIWALVLGLKKTASTFFFMDEGADSGDILSQREIVIAEEDDAGTLYEKVTQVALEQIVEFVPLLASGRYQRKRQNHQNSNEWRKRGMADGKIDWRMSAESIHNLVRGLAKPYVGAHFEVNGQVIKVWKTRIEDGPQNMEPGKVLCAGGDGLLIKCGAGAIRLLCTEPIFVADIGGYL